MVLGSLAVALALTLLANPFSYIGAGIGACLIAVGMFAIAKPSLASVVTNNPEEANLPGLNGV